MPSSRHAKMTRRATSPRFAMRIFLNILTPGAAAPSLRRPDGEEPLPVLYGLPAFDVDIDDLAVVLRVDLVHQLHRLDDAEHLPLRHRRPDLDEGRRTRLRRAIEGTDDRRIDDGELDLGVGHGIGPGW